MVIELVFTLCLNVDPSECKTEVLYYTEGASVEYCESNAESRLKLYLSGNLNWSLKDWKCQKFTGKTYK